MKVDNGASGFFIGSTKGRYKGRTLENYCHDCKLETGSRLQKGCPLYPTKPENTPSYLINPIQTANQLRTDKELGTLNHFLPNLTAWEYTCLNAAEIASNQVQSEAYDEPAKKEEFTANAPTNTSDFFEKN